MYSPHMILKYFLHDDIMEEYMHDVHLELIQRSLENISTVDIGDYKCCALDNDEIEFSDNDDD